MVNGLTMQHYANVAVSSFMNKWSPKLSALMLVPLFAFVAMAAVILVLLYLLFFFFFFQFPCTL